MNHASRTEVSTPYFDQMRRAKIVVTSNPSGWEGDFRLMEAMASGALIVVDKMFVHRPHPLLGDVHIVYYDNQNKTELFDQLDKYRADTKLARQVALQGYLHSMKYHRAASLIDYFFRSVSVQLAVNEAKTPPIYSETGFEMRQKCLDENEAYKVQLKHEEKLKKHSGSKAK